MIKCFLTVEVWAGWHVCMYAMPTTNQITCCSARPNLVSTLISKVSTDQLGMLAFRNHQLLVTYIERTICLSLIIVELSWFMFTDVPDSFRESLFPIKAQIAA